MDANETSSWQSVTDEAALWHARLESGSADTADFEAWRAADPRHAAAFARIAAAAGAFDDLNGIDLSNDKDLAPRAKVNRRALLQWTGIGAAVLGGGAFWAISQGRAYASTGVGGRQTIILPDGGQLDLNTNSKASWRFDKETRQIWLERGELGLALASDPRPCLLHVGKATVALSVGNLNARLRDQSLDLTMLEGNARVSERPDRATAPITVVAGQGAIVGRSEVVVRTISDRDRRFTSGWRQNELWLDGQTLGVVVEEYNRYLTDKIVIVDPGLSGLQLGGRFNTHDPKTFLLALHATFGIKVNQSETGALLLTR